MPSALGAPPKNPLSAPGPGGLLAERACSTPARPRHVAPCPAMSRHAARPRSALGSFQEPQPRAALSDRLRQGINVGGNRPREALRGSFPSLGAAVPLLARLLWGAGRGYLPLAVLLAPAARSCLRGSTVVYPRNCML